jgi:hypothetical protein
MLAIHLELSFSLRLGEEKGQKLIKYFLDVYLEYVGEDAKKAWPLLDYYMAEKAIVCAYTSNVYDHLPLEVMDGYLNLALMHAKRLAVSCKSTSAEQLTIDRSNSAETDLRGVTNGIYPETLDEAISLQEQNSEDMVLAQ